MYILYFTHYGAAMDINIDNAIVHKSHVHFYVIVTNNVENSKRLRFQYAIHSFSNYQPAFGTDNTEKCRGNIIQQFGRGRYGE